MRHWAGRLTNSISCSDIFPRCCVLMTWAPSFPSNLISSPDLIRTCAKRNHLKFTCREVKCPAQLSGNVQRKNFSQQGKIKSFNSIWIIWEIRNSHKGPFHMDINYNTYENSVVYKISVFEICCFAEYSPLPCSKYRAAQGRRDKKGSAPA